MPLAIRVQTVAHNIIRTLGDDAEGTFMALCRSAVGSSSTLGFIAPYSDTMFNAYQLKQFVVEVDAAAQGASLSKEQLAHLAMIRDAAEEAIRRNGYLYIVGD
jgi:hypothetical protein